MNLSCRKSLRFVPLILMCVSVGCGSVRDARISGGGGITKKHAICRAVKEFSEALSGPIENYDITIRSDSEVVYGRNVESWVVSFKAHGEFVRPGAAFFVIIDKKTGSIRTIEGR